MFKLNLTVFLIGTLLASTGGIAYLNYRVDSLNSSLNDSRKIIDKQESKLDSMQNSIAQLEITYKNRAINRTNRDVSDQKMNKDIKRSSVVSSKPKLVEKQINDSFVKFTKGLQEATE